MSQQNIKQFTVADPRSFDGDPYEVAERAVLQAGAVAFILQSTLDGARVMARNAELERELLATGECDAVAWDETVQGRKFAAMIANAEQAVKDCKMLARAAGFNPKARLPKA